MKTPADLIDDLERRAMGVGFLAGLGSGFLLALLIFTW